MLLKTVAVIGLAIAAHAAPAPSSPALERSILARESQAGPDCKKGAPNPNKDRKPEDPFWPTICDLRDDKDGECLVKCVFTEPPIGFPLDLKTMSRKEFCQDEWRDVERWFKRQEPCVKSRCEGGVFGDEAFVSFNKWWAKSTCKGIPMLPAKKPSMSR